MNINLLRQPDFDNLLAVLNRQTPERPTLFEFIMNPNVALGEEYEEDPEKRLFQDFRCYLENGYDFACLPPWLTGFLEFPRAERHKGASISQNEGGLILDEASFESYRWPDPALSDYSKVDEWFSHLPDGARFVAIAPCGVLENLVDLVGFEALCYMLAENPDLVAAVTEGIGTRLLEYYSRLLEFDCVGAVMLNDDWGFKTQTMLAPFQMQEFIFPWHRKIARMVHDAGRPIMLHSCGNLELVWEAIIEDLQFDGKHSYEDGILPVEKAYEIYGPRIAILGGMDIDFLCRQNSEKIYQRARALLEMSKSKGGYALGTGNSLTPYMPRESFLAMRRAALE